MSSEPHYFLKIFFDFFRYSGSLSYKKKCRLDKISLKHKKSLKMWRDKIPIGYNPWGQNHLNMNIAVASTVYWCTLACGKRKYILRFEKYIFCFQGLNPISKQSIYFSNLYILPLPNENRLFRGLTGKIHAIRGEDKKSPPPHGSSQ